MKTQDALTLARHLFKVEGLNAKVSINTRAKRFMGRCKFRSDFMGNRFDIHIELTKWHVEGCSDDKVLNTILHEMAHAKAPINSGHDEAWKAECRKLGMAEKDINRCGDASENKLKPKHKWHGVCPVCSQIFKRHKLNRSIRLGSHMCRENKDNDRIIWIEAKHC